MKTSGSLTVLALLTSTAGLLATQATAPRPSQPDDLSRPIALFVQQKDQAGQKPPKNVGVEEFEKLRADKSNVVLDVRTPKEFAIGHMPGAVNIDFNAADFDQKVSALNKDKTYLVHCAAGRRSLKASEKMSQMNFPKLYNLEGGINAWEKAGNKAEH